VLLKAEGICTSRQRLLCCLITHFVLHDHGYPLFTDAAGGAKKGPKGSKRIVLSLKLKRLVNGLTAAGLAEGQVVPAVVQSVEDRGYSLSFGIKVNSHCEKGAATRHGSC
jgi:hypothetical protein